MVKSDVFTQLNNVERNLELIRFLKFPDIIRNPT